MKKLILYPDIKIVGQDFSNVPKLAVPKQSLTLREIIKRYVRKEPVPTTKDGLYVENMGDLEKLANADLTVRMERVGYLKRMLRKAEEAADEAEKKLASAKAVESPPSVAQAPQVPVTGATVEGQAPPPSKASPS